jgi:hypothetical protein
VNKLSVILLKPDSSSLAAVPASTSSSAIAAYADATTQLTSRISALETLSGNSALVSQMASLTAWVALLNTTGAAQTVVASAVAYNNARAAWVLNPSITITRSGTYLLLGSGRVGVLATGDYCWLIALFKGGTTMLSVSLGGNNPAYGGTLSTGDHNTQVQWTGTLSVGDVITMQVRVACCTSQQRYRG